MAYHHDPHKILIHRRRLRVAQLYIEGHRSYAKLADAWNREEPEHRVARGSIENDLKIVRKWWRESAIGYIGNAVAEELAKLEAIEQEAWAAWHKSKRVAERKRMAKRTTPVDGDGPAEIVEQSMSIETEEQIGDERFLALAMRCLERRAKMLGLDAPSVAELHIPGMAEPTVIDEAKPAATVHDLRREMLNDPAYLDYLRTTATSGDTGAVRAIAVDAQSQVDIQPSPTDSGP